MATVRDNPYGAFNFLVDLGTGQDVAGFSEVTGLGMEIAYLEYRAGSDKRNTVRKIPGLHKVGDVTLKRGLAGSTDLFEWIRAVRDGALDRRNVTITLLDEARDPVIVWRLRNAWPTKWDGPTLNAEGSDVAIET
ncbi:MAG TPA: phage tail protein, partial [Actinomycetota bacterium]